MIAAITGRLKNVAETSVQLEVEPIVYELLVSTGDAKNLADSIGQNITFHTLMYLEGDPNRGNLEPRLLGFLTTQDKKFFELFTTVKGIGPKKALKALVHPTGEIAQAIESRDARYLSQLPQIGKRTAEQVIAELAGKAAAFATPSVRVAAASTRFTPTEEDAISALMALGERRMDAEYLLGRARQSNPKLGATDEFVREMLRLRG